MDHNDHSPSEDLTGSVYTLFEKQEPTPRLRIAHLLLWMLCAAFLLTVHKDQFSDEALPPGFQTYLMGHQLLNGIVGGAVLAGAIVIANGRFRNGLNLPREPGHWLLAIHGFTLFMNSLGSLNFLPSLSQSILTAVVTAATQLISALGYLLASRNSSIPRWQHLFKALFIFALLGSIFVPAMLLFGEQVFDIGSFFWVIALANGLLGLLFLACYIWAVIAVIADRREGITCDWLHWLGVFDFVVAPIIGVLLGVAFALLQFLTT